MGENEKIKEWILIFIKNNVDRIYRIVQDLIFLSQFPEETEKTQSDFVGNVFIIKLLIQPN